MQPPVGSGRFSLRRLRQAKGQNCATTMPGHHALSRATVQVYTAREKTAIAHSHDHLVSAVHTTAQFILQRSSYCSAVHTTAQFILQRSSCYSAVHTTAPFILQRSSYYSAWRNEQRQISHRSEVTNQDAVTCCDCNARSV